MLKNLCHFRRFNRLLKLQPWMSAGCAHRFIHDISMNHRNKPLHDHIEVQTAYKGRSSDAGAFYAFDLKDLEFDPNLLSPEILNELEVRDYSDLSLESAHELTEPPQRVRTVFFEDTFSNGVDLFCNYLQACLYSGFLTHALNVLEFRIRHTKEGLGDVPASAVAREIRVYDIVLCRLSAISANTGITCNFFSGSKIVRPIDIIQKLFHEMQNLHIKPSLISYAAMLEALEKCEQPHVKIALCIEHLEENGYTLNEVVNSCIQGSKSAKCVQNAVNRVASYNDFLPKISPSSVSVDDEEPPELLSDFYSEGKFKPGAVEFKDLSLGMLQNKYDEQVKLEKSRLFEVQSILAVGSDSKELERKKKHLDKMMILWRKVFLAGFRQLKAAEKSKHSSYMKSSWHYFPTRKVYPFLCLLDESTYVDIMVDELCFKANGSKSTMLTSLDLGQQVYTQFALKRMKDTGILPRLKNVYQEYSKIFKKNDLQSSILPRHLWLQLEEKYGLTNLEERIVPWHRYWTVLVGVKLAEIMTTAPFMPYSSSKDSDMVVPAVYNSYIISQKKRYGMTIPHPQLKMLKEALGQLVFENDVAPMVVPPKPWCGISKGGFLINQPSAMRVNHVDLGVEMCSTNLPIKISNQIFDGLNIIGSVPWKINQPILDLQIKYFRNKGSKQLSIAQPSSESDPMPDISKLTPGTPAYEKSRRQARQIQKQREEMYALFMEALYKFSIANEYRNEVIWFPHNIDFRGRSYPIQRHLNYMGSDVYRALFSFAEGRPLGKRGLEWLKIHCINLTEFKKHSPIKERLAYADDVMPHILSSADHPDKDNAWWKGADKPWQTLAACMEIAAALRSPDPEKFISTLPIHQDGSCNGLQHYAALGRDMLGAHQVNLSPSEYQQDVYMGVADKAEELRRVDAENGIEIAKKLEGLIRRKVVKQTVMTTVYGVTRYGGRNQIRRQLSYLENEFPKEECLKGAGYLVDKVFDSITEMFSGAKDIQVWLTNLAVVLGKLGHAVDWVTPISLLVTQPYFKSKEKYIASPIQRITTYEPMVNSPDKLRQVNGFPPNFIHSLDSTHMMLTALNCYKEGVTFSSVHDCFWTHACTVDQMGKICREQFVSLHTQPILHNLANHFRKHLPDSYVLEDLTPSERKLHDLLDNVPKQGMFNLNDVLKSTFFFS